jgi:hypothetical protein
VDKQQSAQGSASTLAYMGVPAYYACANLNFGLSADAQTCVKCCGNACILDTVEQARAHAPHSIPCSESERTLDSSDWNPFAHWQAYECWARGLEVGFSAGARCSGTAIRVRGKGVPRGKTRTSSA